MRGVEQLRHIVGWDWVSSADFVDAIFPLLWEIGDDSASLLAAMRRLLQHRYELGELWTVVGSITSSSSVEEGVGEAYVAWVDHRQDCILHEFVDEYDHFDPDVIFPSVHSETTMLLGSREIDPYDSEVPLADRWIESCSYRLVDEAVMKVVARENSLDTRSGRVVIAVRECAGLRTPQAQSVSAPSESLLAPFPPRLGR
ncbi:MAG: hypothetical protein ACP5O0_08050 [Acidimicrobiales bacterium]